MRLFSPAQRVAGGTRTHSVFEVREQQAFRGVRMVGEGSSLSSRMPLSFCPRKKAFVFVFFCCLLPTAWSKYIDEAAGTKRMSQ